MFKSEKWLDLKKTNKQTNKQIKRKSKNEKTNKKKQTPKQTKKSPHGTRLSFLSILEADPACDGIFWGVESYQ